MPNSSDPWLGASASLVRVEALVEELLDPWYWVRVLPCATSNDRNMHRISIWQEFLVPTWVALRYLYRYDDASGSVFCSVTIPLYDVGGQ